MKPPLFLLVALLSALPASAGDNDILGLSSGLDPRKVCNIDGPEIDRGLVGKLYSAETGSEEVKNGAIKIKKDEVHIYCRVARLVGLKTWGKDLSREWAGKKVSTVNTAKWEKLTKLYAVAFCEDSMLEVNKKRDFDAKEWEQIRESYAKDAAAYVKGAKTPSERNDAIYTLAWIDIFKLGEKCDKWLSDERKPLKEALEAAAPEK